MPTVVAQKLNQLTPALALLCCFHAPLLLPPCSVNALKAMGYSGSWTLEPSRLSNDFYKVLLNLDWKPSSQAKTAQFEAPAQAAASVLGKAANVVVEAGGGASIYMTPADLAIKGDTTLAGIAREYVGSNDRFLQDFAAAWTKAMNADRFKGPLGNECEAAA
jgi:catalase (peroxidase I)